MRHAFDPPLPVLLRFMWPWSTLAQTLRIPRGFDVNDREWWRTEIVSGLGISNARSVARMYGALATGGQAFGVTSPTLEALESPPHVPVRGVKDAVVGVDVYLHLGFMKPSPANEWGTNSRAYGMPGAGGSFGFADPEQQLGFAYVMNRMGYYLKNDPREVALRNAVYAALVKQ